MDAPPSDPFPSFFHALRARHVARAALPDLRKGIQALSALYIEKRRSASGREAFEGEGKRAAFALFYGSLHFLTVRRIVGEIGAGPPTPRGTRPSAVPSAPRTILDLGCGTGVGGAAWALEAGGEPFVEGVDRSPWAVEEARWALKTLGLRGQIRQGDLARARFPGKGGAILSAFSLNELPPEVLSKILPRLLEASERGARVLVVEPIARPLTPWWDSWSRAFAGRGGRSDEWRFTGALPEELEELDRLAGLDHRELTARSLFLFP